MTHTYRIDGMTCGGCVSRVKSELLSTAGIISAEVQLEAPQATITMEKHIPVSRLQEVISKAGNYKISEADGGMHTGTNDSNAADTTENSYYPIFLIFGYITGVSLLIQAFHGEFHWMQWMNHFMAGFFLVFSFFKLMNLRGFAEGYSTYDIVAKRWNTWGFVYPFVELGLGVAYLQGNAGLAINLVTLVVMGVSSIGVIQSLLKGSPFQCACLGTVIKLPLSKVTLFEDLLMVAMSAAGVVYAVV